MNGLQPPPHRMRFWNRSIEDREFSLNLNILVTVSCIAVLVALSLYFFKTQLPRYYLTDLYSQIRDAQLQYTNTRLITGKVPSDSAIARQRETDEDCKPYCYFQQLEYEKGLFFGDVDNIPFLSPRRFFLKAQSNEENNVVFWYCAFYPLGTAVDKVTDKTSGWSQCNNLHHLPLNRMENP